MHNKKGAVALVGLVITATLVAILLVSLLMPQVRNTTDAQSFDDTLVRDAEPTNESVSLEQDAADVVTDSLTIAGLTLGANYSVDYTNALVYFYNNTINGTYTATYDYFMPGYLDTAGERALMAVVILAGIIGLLYLLFRGFGLM